MATSPSLKLTYFDMTSRAEATRVMLRMGGIAFEDERISRETFASLKHTLPYNQVPVLRVGGELLAESQAIGRYVARLAGFYPTTDPVAALMVEEILITISELTETKMVPIVREQDPEAKKLKVEAFVATHVPAAFAQLDARLRYMATYPFFQKTNQVYAHEIALSMLVGLFQSRFSQIMPPHCLDEYATILAVHQKVVDAIASPPTRLPQSALSEVPRPAKLKLTYLDLKARAEFLRLAFHIGDVPFEDERVTLEEVRERKASLPYGQVPVLEIDGFVCAQTFALLRYAGMLSGLYPIQKEPFKAAKMDEIIARVEEIYYKFQASYEEKNPEKRRVLREQLLASRVLQDILASLETRVTQWKQPTSPYIFGQDVTVADLAVYHIVDFIRSGDWDYVPVTIADEFRTLVAVHDAVVAHPRVVDWYATTSK